MSSSNTNSSGVDSLVHHKKTAIDRYIFLSSWHGCDLVRV